jgi:pimeloyl-ACP methyl ester carboxylesterase
MKSMEQIIEIENYKLLVKIQGEGAPILLLHSYWGNHRLFDNLAHLLSSFSKVIRIDLPGHGGSGDPPIAYRFDTFAEILNQLIIRIDVNGPLTLIGHSMGGYVALAFAARYPEKVTSLILMHSLIKNADNISIKLRNKEAELLRNGKRELFLKATIPSNFASMENPNTAELVQMIQQTASQVSVQGALRTIEAMNNRTNFLAMLQKASFTILIIVGKFDKVFNPEGQLEDAAQIPGAEVVLLNHSGHLGFLEEEETVFINLKKFLGLN